MQKTRSGFTIVELLIVIVVIGILAAITIVAYNGVQNRAKATAIADGIKKAEKAFRLKAIGDGQMTWWIDNAFTGNSNPTLVAVINSTNLKDYLQTSPSAPGLPAGNWHYDNDGDVYNGCVADSPGVNIFITGVDQATTQAVDNIIDDGNVSCGKLRFKSSNNEMFYAISNDQTVN